MIKITKDVLSNCFNIEVSQLDSFYDTLSVSEHVVNVLNQYGEAKVVTIDPVEFKVVTINFVSLNKLISVDDVLLLLKDVTIQTNGVDNVTSFWNLEKFEPVLITILIALVIFYWVYY